ncbi:hypothetical protein GN244_ATG11865 [Phytophthora infestans]|uniref:Uncharacterized protein n=1 Tax=Phytophthora infestans TaxID=4787 RepID=A0A833VZY6_PHYIN|nr:hypothetical protein GN244_ATG11865 [Phytophthora infestans]
MKLLSANGCVSKGEERCAFPNHAHLIPDDLHPQVRDHIVKHLGGCASESFGRTYMFSPRVQVSVRIYHSALPSIYKSVSARSAAVEALPLLNQRPRQRDPPLKVTPGTVNEVQSISPWQTAPSRTGPQELHRSSTPSGGNLATR